jgi:hypothetical protein
MPYEKISRAKIEELANRRQQVATQPDVLATLSPTVANCRQTVATPAAPETTYNCRALSTAANAHVWSCALKAGVALYFSHGPSADAGPRGNQVSRRQ